MANPPYVSDDELATLAPEVRDHEPRRALVSGPTGLEAIEELLAEAPRWLAAVRAFVCELAPDQAERGVELARRRRARRRGGARRPHRPAPRARGPRARRELALREDEVDGAGQHVLQRRAASTA